MARESREQVMLLAYVNHHTDYLKLHFEENNILRVKDKQGNIIRLSVNLCCDIIDIDKNRVVAISDIPHTSAYFGSCKMARKWTVLDNIT